MSELEAESEKSPGKEPPPYDYYNPSTWMVDSPESEVMNEEQAAITDDIFAKLSEQHEKVDKEDALKQKEAQDEADETEREKEESGESPRRVLQKPATSQPGSPSPIRLPFRKATRKIFPDEESDSGGEEGNGVEVLSEAAMREQARMEAAKRAMIRHRAQFAVLNYDGEEGEVEEGKAVGGTGDAEREEALLESLLNPANIPSPDPPPQVFALGKDGCAAVWWHYDRGSIPEAAWITEWEVKRYRMDKDGEWRFKGATIINEPHLIDKNRCTVELLENNCQYSFSVTATNRRGRGFESTKSDAVMVEAVLPPGWFRFWHQQSERFFYSNIKTRQAMWTRPEADEWYLDESIILLFNVDERAYLRELYEEEMHHFKRITVQGFKRIMLDVGEAMGKARIRNYLIEYCGKEQITSWTDFMYIVGSIKRKKQHRDRGSNCNMMMNYTVMLPCYIWTECLSVEWTRCTLMCLLGGDAHHERQKIGDWVVEWSPLAERYCYTNSKLHTMTWDTPEEVRFYLPPKMMDTLLQTFSEGDIADFKVRFSHLDLDNSGFIDEHEFKLLLESMDINISDRTRSRLIREIDINGNGTIEFHEFCFMMLNLHQPTSGGKKGGMSSIWDQIKSMSDNEQHLQALTDDMVAVDIWEGEHGEHEQAHNPHFHVRHQRKSIVNSSRDGVHSASGRGLRPGTGGLQYEAYEGDLEGMGMTRLGTAGSVRPGTHAGNRPGTNIESSRPGTHTNALSRATTPFNRSALDTAGTDRPPTSDAIVNRGGGVWNIDMSKGKLLNTNEERQLGMDTGKHAAKSVTIDQSYSYTESHSQSHDHDHSQSQSWDEEEEEAYSEEDSERAASANSTLMINKILQQEQEDAEEAKKSRCIDIEVLMPDITTEEVVEFLLHLHEHSAVCFFYSVDVLDKGIDAVLCKGEMGPHGRHCMCGCRRLVPEDILFPPWTASKDEPLTWNYICPCCCSEN